jgi:hypothetical protein
MSSFSDFSGIAQPELSKECGAYALAAALNQLRIFTPNTTISPVVLGRIDTNNPCHGYGGPSITVENHLNANQFASTLYGVTGNLILNLPGGAATYVNTPNSSITQNPASALIYVARKFGVRNIVISYTESLRDTFQQIHVTNENSTDDKLFLVEERIITSLGYQSRIVTNSEYLYPTSANEVDIVLVNGGTHWVAITWESIVSPDILTGRKPTTVIQARNTGAQGRVVRSNPIPEGMVTPVEMLGSRKIYDPAFGDIMKWEYNSNFATGCWIRLSR